MFDIRFGSGIDELGSLMDASEQCGVIERKGSYYYFASEKLGQVRCLGRGIAAVLWWPADQAQALHRRAGTHPPFLFSRLLCVCVQGRENVLTKIRESKDLQQRLREAVRPKLEAAEGVPDGDGEQDDDGVPPADEDGDGSAAAN